MIEIKHVHKYIGWWVVIFDSLNAYEYYYIDDWCYDNIGEKYKLWYKTISGWGFKNKEDAMLFELT